MILTAEKLNQLAIRLRGLDSFECGLEKFDEGFLLYCRAFFCPSFEDPAQHTAQKVSVKEAEIRRTLRLKKLPEIATEARSTDASRSLRPKDRARLIARVITGLAVKSETLDIKTPGPQVIAASCFPDGTTRERSQPVGERSVGGLDDFAEQILALRPFSPLRERIPREYVSAFLPEKLDVSRLSQHSLYPIENANPLVGEKRHSRAQLCVVGEVACGADVAAQLGPHRATEVGPTVSTVEDRGGRDVLSEVGRIVTALGQR